MLQELRRENGLRDEELTEMERKLCELCGDPHCTVEAVDFATRSLARLLPAYRALAKSKALADAQEPPQGQ